MMEAKDAEALLDDLQRSRATLHAVAKRHAMRMRDLAQWAEAPENARALRSLRALADSRAALVVGRARIVAARNLLRIASDRENTETARKACVDLFNLRTPDACAPVANAPAEAPSDAAIQSLLAKLGAEATGAAS